MLVNWGIRVRTADGQWCAVQDLRAGDLLEGSTSTVQVLSTRKVKAPCAKLYLSTGAVVWLPIQTSVAGTKDVLSCSEVLRRLDNSKRVPVLLENDKGLVPGAAFVRHETSGDMRLLDCYNIETSNNPLQWSTGLWYT